MITLKNKPVGPKVQGQTSPLDHPIRITHFPDVSGAEAPEKLWTLRKFEKEVRKTRAASKEKLPLRKLATFGGKQTDKGSLRHDANVTAVTGAEGDYDGGVVTMSEAASLCRVENVAAFIYASPSATSDNHRWRVMCPFSKEYPPADRARFVARLNGVLGGILSPESFTLSQSFFYGNVQGTPERWTILVEGGFLDLDDDLDEGAQYPIDKAPRERDEGTGSKAPLGLDLDVIRDCVMTIPNEGKFDDRSEWFPIIAGLNHETEGSEEGRTIAHEWSAQHGSYSEEHTDKTWNSLRDRRENAATFRTVIYEAEKHGWQRSEGLVASGSKSTLTRYRVEAILEQPFAVDFLESVLYEGDLSMITGRNSVGKSFFVLDMALHVALGDGWHGLNTKQTNVLYVALEGQRGVRKRFEAWCRHHEIDPHTFENSFARHGRGYEPPEGG